MSHEFLSDMLGSTRSTMSIAAAQLKSENLIQYTRGVIHILDTKGLEKKACECYQVVEDYLDSYIQFDSGIAN
jgi:Mn-dependent DtxR family transcriptional regulator